MATLPFKRALPFMKNCLVLAAFCLSNTATGQRLPELILLAQENNPELQAYELRYSLAREKLAEANQYPDTEVSAGLFVSEPETRTGAQKARFSIRQMLPWFGVITARENYASAMADAEYESLSMARRQLVMDVALAYYGLVTNHESARVINENISLINNYEQQALIAVEVGKASVVDVLRLRIRLNELQERIAILKEEFISMETAMNALLNRALNTPVMVSDSLVIPAEDPAPDLSSIAAHPELLKYDRLFESVAMAEFINQKESAPNLGFGLDYVPVQERPDMAFSDNGKDILMPMVSLSIPIFNNSYEALSRQNTLRQQELTALRKDRENMLRSRLQTAITSRNTARIRFQTQADNLEQAKNAEQILLRNYETGRVDYKEVLDIMDMVIKIRLARIEAAHNYFIQSAVINYLAEPMQ